MLVDTHCHLADPAFDPDREAVVERALGGGVAAVVVVADSLESSVAARRIASGHGCCFATAGLHPHRAAEFGGRLRAEIESLARGSGTIAVGETGLDFHYEHSPREIQRECFAWQLELAASTGKPAVIHARQADGDAARLIQAAPPNVTGVMHSFSSGPDLLDAALERGFHVSFSGMVTFAKWNGNWAVERVPDDKLLIETDAPFLAPVPHRGRRNEPAFLPATARRIAEIRGVSAERIAELTSANAVRLFRLSVPNT